MKRHFIDNLLHQLKTEHYVLLSLLVFAVAFYLCLVNLDYAALWHDEASSAILGSNFLEKNH